MTSYRYNLTVDESEAITLIEALNRLESYCEAEIEAGKTSPYYVWRDAAVRVKEKIYRGAELASTNTFGKSTRHDF